MCSCSGFGSNPTTVLRFPFPLNSSYMLQQDAAYILPIGGQGSYSFDVDSGQSLLWMVANDTVSRGTDALQGL